MTLGRFFIPPNPPFKGQGVFILDPKLPFISRELQTYAISNEIYFIADELCD